MANFLVSSACRGVRPRSVDLKNKFTREHLISKLMSQRSVLRYINAPDGFGKSILAGQYAQLVFSFRDVFWINCKSPCFIRDLDSDEITKQILQICANPKLVVFDDFNNISEDRQDKFSCLVDEILALDCEVMVTASEDNVLFIKKQPDALILNSQDLLLNQSELKIIYDDIENLEDDVIKKIPIIAWNKDGVNKLLKRAVKEGFTDEILFCLFYIYLFKCGDVEDLKTFIGKSGFHLLFDINSKYLYFGINEDTNKFSVLDISVKELKDIFMSRRDLLLKYFNVDDNIDFANKIMKIMEAKCIDKRACEFIQCFGNKELKTQFLTKYNFLSISDAYMVEASTLYESITFNKNDSGLNQAFQALRLAILSYRSDAVRLSYSILDNKNTYIDNKLFAALVFMRFGETEEKLQAIKIIRFLNNDFKIDQYLKSKKISKEDKYKCKLIHKVIDIYLSINSDNINPFEVWLKSMDDTYDDTDIISAECLLNSAKSIKTKFLKSEACHKFISSISRHYNYGSKFEFNFYTYGLIKSYLNARSVFEEYAGLLTWDISNDLMLNYEYYEKKLKIDRNKFFLIHKTNYSNFENISLKDFEALNRIGINYKNILPTKYMSETDVPRLYIKVFGGLSVYIGGKEIIKTDFGRQNIKLICCILTLEKGQEINKDKISGIIWPDSDLEQRRINMNTHWSSFRKFLTLSNGVCPYLVRSQNSYKLNNNYCSSDLEELDDLCSDLTMGSIDSQSWLEKINRNENIINGDLLPSETDNSYIKTKRQEYKNQIVNALIAASERLLDAGEVQQALWFANKAYMRDNNREDVYVTLMSAQMHAGQRTPAIETYLACKKFLENKLGIEPSLRINNLYDEVVSNSSY